MTPLTTSFRLSRCCTFTVVKTSIPASAALQYPGQRLGWREPCALLCASSSIKISAGRRARYPCQIREFAAPVRVTFGGRMVSPPRSAAVLHGRVSTTPITTSSLRCSRCACAASPVFFRRLRRRRRKFFNFRGAGGVCSNKRSGSGRRFVAHFASKPCSASSARLSSTIFTTGCCPQRASACAYILQTAARPVQRKLASRRHAGISLPRRRVSDYYPARLPTPSPAQPEPRNSPG